MFRVVEGAPLKPPVDIKCPRAHERSPKLVPHVYGLGFRVPLLPGCLRMKPKLYRFWKWQLPICSCDLASTASMPSLANAAKPPGNLGALIIRIGFWGYYTFIIIRNHQNPIPKP